MTEVSINDRAVGTSDEDGDTLESLLDSLRGRGEIGSAEVMVALEVDSRSWAADELDRLGDVALADVRQVAIATDDMRGYGRRILTDAAGMLAVLQEAATKLAHNFRHGDPKEANADLFNLLDAFQRFFGCVYHVKNTCAVQNRDLDSPEGLLGRVDAALDLVAASHESEDWPALADRVEKDLLPAIAGFEVVLQDLRDAI